MLRLALAIPLPGLARENAAAWEKWQPERAARHPRGVELVPNGEIPDAGWALARLNDGSGSELQAFSYPETTTRVRLYLIDTAVKHTSTWFAKNPKLSFKGTTRIYSAPTASKSFVHGTRMLGVIAGPETGAALGTPIDVVNYDVYPGAEGVATTSSLVASAVNKAKIHYLTTSPRRPSVICIASGSTSPEDDAALKYYVQSAVASNITVVVSAGNLGMDASGYIPAAYGTQDGVICSGASDKFNQPLPSSNYGAPVDLHAPGDDVRTVRYSSPKSGYYDLMDGTSPAAGLVTAAALIELSKNPALTPAQVEDILTAGAYQDVQASLVQVEPPPEEPDTDGDGAADVLEAFFGSDGGDPASKPAPPSISVSGEHATLSFQVPATLFNPLEPRVLSSGDTWKVQISEDLIAWEDIEATVAAGAEEEGMVPLTVSVPAAAGTAFLRVEVTAAPASE